MTRTQKLVGGAVALLVVGGAGGAIAATQLDSPSAQSAAIVTDAANQLGVTPTALSNALMKAEEDQIDSEVSSGELTQAQGDQLKSAIESGALPLVGTPGLGGGMGMHVMRVGPFADLSAASSYLGLSTDQIQTDLQNGQTLAQIATAQGKTADGLVSALVAAAKSKLDTAVGDGKLTSDQEANILPVLQTEITNEVDATNAGFGGGRGGFGGGFARPGFGFGLGGNLSAVATYLGLSTDQIQTDLQNGQTLAQIATGQGKTADGLVSAVVAAEKTNLDQAVSDGKLTADQETNILSMAQKLLTNFVNGTRANFGGPGFAFGFGRFDGVGPGPAGGTSPSNGTGTIS
jgi:hypothetical protein